MTKLMNHFGSAIGRESVLGGTLIQNKDLDEGLYSATIKIYQPKLDDKKKRYWARITTPPRIGFWKNNQSTSSNDRTHLVTCMALSYSAVDLGMYK